MRYLLLGFTFYYVRKIHGIIMSKLIQFNDSLSFMIIMFSAEFFGGLAVFIYQNLYFSKKKKIKEKENYNDDKNITGIKLIHEEARMNINNSLANTFKIIILIFFISYFDYGEFIMYFAIPEIYVLSPTSDQRLLILITMTSSLLCTHALKIKTGKHHNFSLIGMSLCSIIIFGIELIYKSKGINFDIFISSYLLFLFRLPFVSLIDVTEKYLMDFKHINKFKILSMEGFFGIILCIIYAFINKKNPLKDMNKVYINLDIGKKILMIIFLILYFFLSAGVNIYRIIANAVYSPMVQSLIGYFLNPLFIIYYFFYEKDFQSGGEQNYFYFIINVILSIIIDFFAAVYNEFLIINCFGLQEDTHYEISIRSKSYSLTELDELEKFDNDNDIESSFNII